jgi:hypothetical protein
MELINVKRNKVSDNGKGKAKYDLEGNKLFVEQVAMNYFEKEGYNSIWSENHYWWELMMLLFWDIIFAKTKGAVETANSGYLEPNTDEFNKLFDVFVKTNGMPADLFSDEFYNRRKDLINNRIKELKNKDIGEVIKKNYKTHSGENCRLIENWDKFSLDELLIVSKYINTNNFLEILKRLLKNISNNRSGFPDLIIYNEQKISFVEVKSKNDSMSDNQVEWKSFFESLNLTYILFLVNHTKRQISNIKNKLSGNSKDVKVIFGDSSSKYREEAIEFIKKQETFFTDNEGKEQIYGALFSIKKIEDLYKILDLTSRWKSSKFFLDGEEISAKKLRSSLWCYRKKNENNASIDYCKTNEYSNEKNKFDCRQVNLDVDRWTEYGYVDTQNGDWIFNKEKLENLVEDIINSLELCPLFKSNKLEKHIKNLPIKINPKENKKWSYISAERSRWFYNNGEWVCSWSEKEFPGYSSMIGIEKISKEERNNYIENQNYTKNINFEIKTNKKEEKKSGCFIATAVYEDYNSKEVLRLRKYRDEKLKNSIWGRIFIRTYYTISPPISEIIKKHNILKKLIKPILDKIILKLDN